MYSYCNVFFAEETVPNLQPENTLEDLESFINTVSVEVQDITEEGMTMEFDLIGVMASVANALRRALLVEVGACNQDYNWILDQLTCATVSLGVPSQTFSALPSNFLGPFKFLISVIIMSELNVTGAFNGSGNDSPATK